MAWFLLEWPAVLTLGGVGTAGLFRLRVHHLAPLLYYVTLRSVKHSATMKVRALA
jgi:hypothetical protein